MLVYLFEYYALGNNEAALAHLIAGGHVVVVFLLAMLLSRVRASFEAAGIRRKWFFGLRLTTRKLPNIQVRSVSVLRLVTAQLAILFAIYASTF